MHGKQNQMGLVVFVFHDSKARQAVALPHNNDIRRPVGHAIRDPPGCPSPWQAMFNRVPGHPRNPDNVARNRQFDFISGNHSTLTVCFLGIIIRCAVVPDIVCSHEQHHMGNGAMGKRIPIQSFDAWSAVRRRLLAWSAG
jgi:hypothetical protein